MDRATEPLRQYAFGGVSNSVKLYVQGAKITF